MPFGARYAATRPQRSTLRASARDTVRDADARCLARDLRGDVGRTDRQRRGRRDTLGDLVSPEQALRSLRLLNRRHDKCFKSHVHDGLHWFF